MGKQMTDRERLGEFLARHPRLTVLTGAGISRAAGIPTYRDGSGRWRHSTPVTHREFLTQHGRRQRYWARSLRGWPAVERASPTPAHRALADLESRGHIDTVITQNVDRLHQRAGSRRVIDLHGRLDRVQCLQCSALLSRGEVQRRLLLENGDAPAAAQVMPDGDAVLPAAEEAGFTVPDCAACGGILMPDVVFFGANVPRARVAACGKAIERSDALLVIGSSLQVFSGFRFCRMASELGKPLALVNPGVTRADRLAQLKLVEDCQTLLPAIARL